MSGDWTSDSFRSVLMAMVRRHVPERDSEDVVQAVLCEALSSELRPAEPVAARRWIWGVTRHKIADYHRRSRHEILDDTAVADTRAVSDDALTDMMRWAVGELPEGADAPRTFAWLLREAEGETLEEIAQHEQLPATQVRQRVSRLRKHFRTRWTVYAALGLFAALGYLVTRRHGPSEHGPTLWPSPEAQPAIRGHMRRSDALADCARHDWSACLAGLDGARDLDPVGDAEPGIQILRRQALDGLRHNRIPAQDAGLDLPAPWVPQAVPPLTLPGNPEDASVPVPHHGPSAATPVPLPIHRHRQAPDWSDSTGSSM